MNSNLAFDYVYDQTTEEAENENTNTEIGYDLETFDVRAKSRRGVKSNGKNFEQRKKRAASRVSAFKIVLFTFVVVSFFAVNVYGYVQLTESTAMVAKLQKQLDELKNENKTLTVKYDSMIDLAEIERLAVYEYGMEKQSGSNVEYITMSGGDSVEILSENSGIGDIIPTTFRRLSAFFEYFY